MDEQSFQHDDWRVGVSVCLERAGRAILGKGLLELLESIDRCCSISAAARELGISYRHAWELVQNVNEGVGAPLVTSSVGGAGGGGAALTPLGQRRLPVPIHYAAAVLQSMADSANALAFLTFLTSAKAAGRCGRKLLATSRLSQQGYRATGT